MGAHVPLVRAPNPTTLLLSLLLLSSSILGLQESEILLRFKNSLSNTATLTTWNPSTSPCSGDIRNWVGVICHNGSVWGLQLENMGLKGTIDVDALVFLPFLRTLSFMNNNFDSKLPDLKKLGALKSVYLSNNGFSGEIPDNAFEGMIYLKKVYLSNNRFSGKIPSSLAALPRLRDLRLEGNQFQGQIPNFSEKDFKLINVSNNKLQGPIPISLSRMDLSSFSGNKELCGHPLDSCSSSKKPSSLIIMLGVAFGLMLVAIIAAIIISNRSSHRKLPQLERNASLAIQHKLAASTPSKVQYRSSENATVAKKGEHGKLQFVRDDTEKFDLTDLLRAGAEVLGSATFGSSYKAVLSSGHAVVVKRYKQMNNVGREEFQEHMRRIGRLRHSNLLALVAYYYRKDEKLLISDFVENGSLASHLHGNHSVDKRPLDWPTRLKIIKGVMKGLAYLYSELPSLIVPHGHLKSSNVLLDESFKPLLTDYTLLPVINQDHAQKLMVAYKSPEFAQYGRTMKKTDVWGLGILILEILTGKFPANYLMQGNASDFDLASWVRFVIKEESTRNEVFDKEMGGKENAQGEMEKLLRIGLACCEEDVEIRKDLKKVVEEIEELKERDSDDESYSSNVSDQADLRL